MAATILHDPQIDPAPLVGRRIAVLGYGNQGHAHARNLRDCGLSVIVGSRPGRGFERAACDGFAPLAIPAAVAQADFVIMALPDEAAAAVYADQVAPFMRRGHALGFIHGFNIHYGQIVAPPDVDVILTAPKGAGYMVRQAFESGGGLMCLVAVDQDATGQALALALAWARGIGGGRAGVLLTTFEAETETDLFGEQAAVVGGVTALMQAAFDTLVQAGYEPEHAYLECIHEVKFVVDLIHAQGFTAMRKQISATAAFGELTSHQALAEAVRPAMGHLLASIRSGDFARRWIGEAQRGCPALHRHTQAQARGLAEEVGEYLRRAAPLPQRKYHAGRPE